MSNGDLEKLRILHNFTFTPHSHQMRCVGETRKLVSAFGVSLHKCCGVSMVLRQELSYAQGKCIKCGKGEELLSRRQNFRVCLRCGQMEHRTLSTWAFLGIVSGVLLFVIAIVARALGHY